MNHDTSTIQSILDANEADYGAPPGESVTQLSKIPSTHFYVESIMFSGEKLPRHLLARTFSSLVPADASPRVIAHEALTKVISCRTLADFNLQHDNATAITEIQFQASLLSLV